MKTTLKLTNLLPWETRSLEIVGVFSTFIIGICLILGIDASFGISLFHPLIMGVILLVVSMCHYLAINDPYYLPIRSIMNFIESIFYLWVIGDFIKSYGIDIAIVPLICLFVGLAYSFLLNFTLIVEEND